LKSCWRVEGVGLVDPPCAPPGLSPRTRRVQFRPPASSAQHCGLAPSGLLGKTAHIFVSSTDNWMAPGRVGAEPPCGHMTAERRRGPAVALQRPRQEAAQDMLGGTMDEPIGRTLTHR
jgi:hypothetical protein